jgi:cyclase
MSFRLAISSATIILAAFSQFGERADARTLQDEQPAMTVESTDLGGGLHMLSTHTGIGNLALLVGADGAVMVDDQLPDNGSLVEDAIEAIAGEGAPRFIVSTHYHGDHSGGNAYFAERGTTIAAHHNIRTRLENSDAEWAQVPGTLPIMTFGQDLTFHMNGQTVEATHINAAHTDGDAVVFFREANVLHMGDIFFSGLFPFIDLAGGGTVDGYLAGMEAALAMTNDETRIIPGHGPLSSPADLQASIDLLREASFRVRTLVEGGADLEAVLAANPLADYDADWSWFFISTDRMVRTLYNDAVGNDYAWQR